MPKFIKRTGKQNAALHKLLGQRGFTDDDKAEMVFDVTKGRTEHSSEMSVAECNSMIERLGGTAFGTNRTRRSPLPKNLVPMLTGDQRDKLVKLRAARNMGDEGFERLCRHTIKKPAPRTVNDAQKMIEAIKVLIERDSKIKPMTGGLAA